MSFEDEGPVHLNTSTKRKFESAFVKPQIVIETFIPHISSFFATFASFWHRCVNGTSQFIGENLLEWQSQQKSAQQPQRSKKKRKKVVQGASPQDRDGRRTSRRNARSQKVERDSHQAGGVNSSPSEGDLARGSLPSSSLDPPGSASPDQQRHMEDPTNVNSRSMMTQSNRNSLRAQYTKTLQARERLALVSGGTNAISSTSSPFHRGLFASKFDRHNTRSSVTGNRTAKDAMNVLNRITPHKSRIGKERVTSEPGRLSFPFTEKNLSHYLESPQQNSPLVNYRSPGAPLSSPGPTFNPFKTKHGVRNHTRSTDNQSLEELIAQLRRDHPHQYEWRKIDKNKRARDEEIARKRGLLKPIRAPIPLETMKKVERALHGQVPEGKVLVERFNQEIRSKDLSTLKNTAWLNDEVINFYMNLIAQRSKSDSKNKIHAFNTFFYTKLADGGYSDVRRWAKKAKVDISQCDLVLVPVHLGVHWCMSVINAKQRRFEYWDSLRGGAGRAFSKLREYMRNEAPSVKIDDWDDWMPDSGPQQRNGYDCGVFACQTAECVSRDVSPNFTQEEMPELRKRMAASILDCQIY